MTTSDTLAAKVATLSNLMHSLNADPRPTTDDYLQALPLVVLTAESAVRDAVAQARTEGASWDAIGRRLGVSRQAAWERYGA